MEKQITMRVCDVCLDAGKTDKPSRAQCICPICLRDACKGHTRSMDLIGEVCSCCYDAIMDLSKEEMGVLHGYIAEILKPIVVVKKL